MNRDVGFVVAALQPHRAAGLVPMAAALVAVLATIAVVDVERGTAHMLAEAQHVVEGLGLLLLWLVSRPGLRRSRVMRLHAA